MGSRVTVIEESGQIASRENEDVALALYEVPMLRSFLFFVAFVDFWGFAQQSPRIERATASIEH
jgi:hypothetical protein